MKTLITSAAILGVTATIALSSPTFGQDRPAPEEARQQAQKRFAAADTNDDGALSLAEWQAAGRRQRGFEMLDADKDGRVTPLEIRSAAERAGAARNR